MSDVFGLKTDESLVQEKRTAHYEKLRDTKNLTEQQKRELDKLVEELSTAPQILRSNMLMSEEHLDLLKTIQQKLAKARKS